MNLTQNNCNFHHSLRLVEAGFVLFAIILLIISIIVGVISLVFLSLSNLELLTPVVLFLILSCVTSVSLLIYLIKISRYLREVGITWKDLPADIKNNITNGIINILGLFVFFVAIELFIAIPRYVVLKEQNFDILFIVILLSVVILLASVYNIMEVESIKFLQSVWIGSLCRIFTIF